jgi:NADH:ubiquinone oxidoreductase subunit 3 (subunit A)
VLTAVLGTRLLAPFAPSRGKGTSYECGMLPNGRVRTQIHVRYYIYAILFLIFDVEAVFLFPWAVSVVDLGEVALYSMILFILILGGGLGYAWKKGVLEWK